MFLFVTNRKSGNAPKWVEEIFKGLGISSEQIEPKVINQTELTETNIFVNTVTASTGTVCIISNQISRNTLQKAVQTGKKILVFSNNDGVVKYTYYEDGAAININTTERTAVGATNI